MAGLIPTGESYRNQALSGFVRLSAQEEQQRLAEEKLKAQERAQTVQMIGQGASIGISIALLAIALA
jgi:hypothetical protein